MTSAGDVEESQTRCEHLKLARSRVDLTSVVKRTGSIGAGWWARFFPLLEGDSGEGGSIGGGGEVGACRLLALGLNVGTSTTPSGLRGWVFISMDCAALHPLHGCTALHHGYSRALRRRECGAFFSRVALRFTLANRPAPSG